MTGSIFVDKNKIFRYRYLLLILSGCASSLPTVFPKLGFLQWVSMIPCLILLYICACDVAVKKRQLYFYGIVYFWSYYAIAFHWFLYMYPMEFAGLSKGAAAFVVLLAMFGLSLLQALMSALSFVLLGVLARGETLKRHTALMPLVFAFLYVIIEWWQTVGWWGVPWARLCLGQSSYIYTIQSASLFGSYFVTFLIVLVNAYIGYAVLNTERARLISAVCVGIVVANTAFGAIYSNIPIRSDKDGVKVAAIQGNIDADAKWESGVDQYLATVEVYEKYTRMAANEGAQIVLWPETALPYSFFNNSYGMVTRISSLARECNITLLISTFTEGEAGGVYNSCFAVYPDGTYGEDIYAKQHLVPFGEFVPMEDIIMTLIPPLSEIQMLDRDILFGNSSSPLYTEYGYVSVGICFDSIYENVILESVRESGELICIATNDSWFRDSRALYMHNAQSVFRAVENGRYLLRAANTGISTVISPRGEIMDICAELTEGYAMGDVCMLSGRTLYSYIGNALVYLSAGFVISIPVIDAVLSKIRRKALNS